MSNDKHKNKYQDKRGKALPERKRDPLTQ